MHTDQYVTCLYTLGCTKNLSAVFILYVLPPRRRVKLPMLCSLEVLVLSAPIWMNPFKMSHRRKDASINANWHKMVGLFVCRWVGGQGGTEGKILYLYSSFKNLLYPNRQSTNYNNPTCSISLNNILQLECGQIALPQLTLMLKNSREALGRYDH